ncbi:MAG TPA: hypothetical protein PKH07_10775, partial [bacterium]|nr:hypothetical protein [bacterium]
MAESSRRQLALDTIQQKPTQGIPSWMLHVMQHSHIERLADCEPGRYKADPENVYIRMQQRIGTCLLDQYIPTNPLTMGDHGFEENQPGACRGADTIIVDGMFIDSPEAVVEHLETCVFPEVRRQISAFDEDTRVHDILNK